MSLPQRIGNVLGVFVPLAGVLAAIVLLWDRFVGPRDLAITGVLYVLTGFGITVGFHRLLTHRSFDSPAPVRAVFAVLGSMAVQGPVIHWVADHRKHHAYTDVDGDPHSPHLAGRGFAGSLKGLWHAHVAWLWTGGGRANPLRYAKDLLEDRVIRFVSRTFVVWVALGFVVPFLLGYALSGGSLRAGVVALVWGGLVRIFLLHQVTFAINSLCHFLGRRRFPTEDESRNVAWLAPLSFGEAWHNNHHAFPSSAFHGLRAREIDPGAYLIRLLEKLHLATNVRRIPPERQAARATGP
jgi:stearoyl-CoA desaturase (delta-9 desaturase)